MTDDNQERHYNEEQVTGARQEHVVRWVLGISLILVTIALSATWIIASVAK
ncbi:MAG TPA: hypothetical protein VFK50_06920 [Sphingomicrobium sp.]|nr:hypothetical protein [Sphingomicrobium sp.]